MNLYFCQTPLVFSKKNRNFRRKSIFLRSHAVSTYSHGTPFDVLQVPPEVVKWTCGFHIKLVSLRSGDCRVKMWESELHFLVNFIHPSWITFRWHIIYKRITIVYSLFFIFLHVFINYLWGKKTRYNFCNKTLQMSWRNEAQVWVSRDFEEWALWLKQFGELWGN